MQSEECRCPNLQATSTHAHRHTQTHWQAMTLRDDDASYVAFLVAIPVFACLQSQSPATLPSAPKARMITWQDSSMYPVYQCFQCEFTGNMKQIEEAISEGRAAENCRDSDCKHEIRNSTATRRTVRGDATSLSEAGNVKPGFGFSILGIRIRSYC